MGYLACLDEKVNHQQGGRSGTLNFELTESMLNPKYCKPEEKLSEEGYPDGRQARMLVTPMRAIPNVFNPEFFCIPPAAKPEIV